MYIQLGWNFTEFEIFFSNLQILDEESGYLGWSDMATLKLLKLRSILTSADLGLEKDFLVGVRLEKGDPGEKVWIGESVRGCSSARPPTTMYRSTTTMYLQNLYYRSTKRAFWAKIEISPEWHDWILAGGQVARTVVMEIWKAQIMKTWMLH